MQANSDLRRILAGTSPGRLSSNMNCFDRQQVLRLLGSCCNDMLFDMQRGQQASQLAQKTDDLQKELAQSRSMVTKLNANTRNIIQQHQNQLQSFKNKVEQQNELIQQFKTLLYDIYNFSIENKLRELTDVLEQSPTFEAYASYEMMEVKCLHAIEPKVFESEQNEVVASGSSISSIPTIDVSGVESYVQPTKICFVCFVPATVV